MKNRITQLYILLCFFSFQQMISQTSFGKVALTKVEKSKQKTTDQSIFQDKIQPVEGTEFRLIKTETDKLGMVHRTYQQYYNGIKVHFGTIKVHEKNGLRQTYGGAYFNPKGVNLNPSLSISRARKRAKSFIGSNDVFWVGDDGISKTEMPEPELLILPNRREKTMHLVYAIAIGTSQPELKMGVVYIDAQTGKIVKYKNLVSTCFDTSHGEENHVHEEKTNTSEPFALGTGATVYSGSQTIQTTFDTDYILYDQTRANTGQGHNHGAGTRNGIVTVNFNNHDILNDYNSSYVTDFMDSNNNWTSGEMSTNEDQYALDAHFGSQIVYDYWKNEYGRDSYDGNDASIVSYVHFDTNYTNAAWVAFNSQRGFMIYGDGGGSFTPLTNLDVVAHEIGHGVTNATSNLDYELESGALNEGFSDIWAALIDDYANNNYTFPTSKQMWLINDENGGGTLRSLSNPNAHGQPDTYGGTYWYDVSSCTPDGTNNDYCGVHTNSGVLNHWFYRLVNGGSGTNDIGNNYSVSGIGINSAATITYRMESVYLTNTSDFADARAASIQAAADLFGYCSSEEEAVTNAWHAVGVGVAYSGTNPSVTVDVTDLTVCVDEIATFYAEADYANTMIWQSDESGSWADLSEDATYSGVTTNTLTVTNPPEALDGVRFRLKFSNNCGSKSTTNNRYLYVKTLPDVTSVMANGAGCSSTTDGSLTVSFNDVSNLSNLEFSIDGGTTYPYNYADTSSSQIISGLAAGDYNVWVRRGGNDCPREIGTYTVTTVPTVTASIDSIIEADISQNDGILQVSFPDEATQTNIKFSTDGGATFPHSFDDTLGTGELTGLGAGTYDVWVSFGDDSCSKNLGSFTVNEMVYTQIPDANFENALNNLTYDNYLGDSKVPTSLINTITSLNVRLESISDLTGIQDFASLEILYADNNDLTSIDVSSNTVLRILRLYNNYNLTSFSVANPAIIEFLTLTDCNLSGHLDLSNYTALTTLSVKSNDLSGLNIKNGNNNNIGNFDARGNANLDCIIVDDAAYSTTNWTDNGGATFTDADYCDYTLIPDDNFEAALDALGYDDILGDNKVPTALIEVVTNLDVNTQAIADLTGIQDFTALTDLNCESNSLTSLDVSANLNLQSLNFDNNTIASLLLGANSNLDRIEGRYNSLSTLDLSQNTGITFLNLRNNNFATIDVSNNINLQTINLHENGITGLDVTTNINLVNLFLRASNFVNIDVSQNVLLESLNLDSCNLTNLDVSNNLALRVLKVVGNNITHLDLSLNTALTSIECNDNIPLTYLSVKNGNNTNVTTFEATGNSSLSCIVVDDVTYSTTNWVNIDTGTAFSVTDYCNYTLVPDINFEAALDALGYDDITADGQVPTTLIDKLTSLNVSGQSISDLTGIEDFIALMSLNCSSNTLSTLNVSANTNLESLSFSNNTITAIDLTNNVLLESIFGFENNLTTIDLSQNVVVDKIDLDTNLLTALDVSANTLLESLDVINNSLTGIDLSNNLQLTGIYLSSNSISSLDLSNNTLLEDVECIDCELTSLNLKNGNNTAIGYFDLTINPDLNCIAVDDVAYSTTNWTNIDAGTGFSVTNYCNYTVIPDLNFENELEALGYDDISSDGQVPTALIEVVETLDVENKSIADLTGIEDFLALKTLDVSYNSLSALNLINNTELRQLIVRSNNITDIDLSANTLLIGFKAENSLLTTLDVSNNLNLKVLWLTGNDLTAIDLSNNIALTSFWGNGNDFITPDLSNNVALNSFRANNNSLTSLDLRNGNNTNITGGTNFQLTGNAGLGCVLVDDAAYSAANWLGIDGSVSFSDTDCNYTLIPDTNFEAWLNTLGFDDISSDGKVPTSLIEAITSLSIANQSIVDLTGIEDFAALESFYADNNSIITADFSNNVNLKVLDVSNNASLTSLNISNNLNLEELFAGSSGLTSIDLSNNAALKIITLFDNDLTALNVTNNLNLESIQCQNNLIESLDFSLNAALTFIEVSNNALTSLNIKNGINTSITVFAAVNNTGLTCVLVDDVTYSNTNWSLGIDITASFSNTYCRYTYVPDDNFETALRGFGYDDGTVNDDYVPTALIEAVTILNVGSSSIVDLTGIEDFTALEEIQCHNNDIVTLDFSNNLNLTYIRAYNNQSLTSLNVSNNTELDYLTCSSNGSRVVLTSLDLTNNPKLETLNITQTSITSIDLSQNLLLDKLTCRDTYLTSLDLSSNAALTELDAKSNNLLSDLNVQNGNNTNVTSFDARTNTLLSCILVDDAAYSTTNWTNIDGIASFNEASCSIILSTGNLIISEVMQNPNTVSDANGEYFEIYNNESESVNLNGWTISDSGTDSHTVNTDLIVDANSFIVLGNNNDLGTNGGVIVDYQYTSIDLNNGSDAIILSDGSATEIDRVEYDGGILWPNPDGAAMIFVGSNLKNNNDGSLWETATVAEGITTDLGSPRINGTNQIIDWLVFENNVWNQEPSLDTDLKNVLIEDSETYTFASDSDLNNLVINEDANVQINNGITVNSTTVIMESSSTQYSSLISDGTLTGEHIYKRHVNQNQTIGGNDLISPPVSGDTFDAFLTSNTNIVSNTSGSLYLFGPFDKDSGSYITYSSTETASLISGIGYRAATTNNSTLNFSGTINQSNVSIPVSVSGSFFSEWNLIGNPYPSYLNVQDFLNNTTNAGILDENNISIYGYDGDVSDGWLIYNLNTTDANTVITPGQGFFVAVDSDASIEFTPSMRRHGASDDFILGRTNINYHFKLELNSNNQTHNTDFYFNDNSTSELDPGYDSGVFGGVAGGFAIYSQLVEENQNIDFAIQSLPIDFLSEGIIPLGINASGGQQLSIEIETLNLPDTVDIYLVDTEENIFTQLNTSNYVFTPTIDLNGTGRFYIGFSDDVLSVSETELNNIEVHYVKRENIIRVNGQLENKTKAQLYDINGRVVVATNFNRDNNENSISTNGISKGVYVLKIEDSKQINSFKVIIN